MVRSAVCVPAFQTKKIQALLDGVLENETINRERVEPPSERESRGYFAPIAAEKSGPMLTPQNRQTADIAGPPPDSRLTTDARTVEINQIEIDVVARSHGEHIAHGKVAVEDPGIVDSPGKPTETGKKRPVIDLGEFPCVRVHVEATEKLPDFDGALQKLCNKERRAFDFIRLHPHQRFGRREADPHELLCDSPAPFSLAPPETALGSFFQTLVLELLDDYWNSIGLSPHFGGINVVAPPMNCFNGGRRIDQA